MLKKITATIMLLVASFALVGAAMVTESNIIYDLRQGYIDLTKISIDLKETDEYIPFTDSVKALKEKIETEGTTGSGKTSVYFENDKDRENNTLRVDIDFSGETLIQPVNTMFVVDQSGSMNMVSGQTSTQTYLATTPCLHDNHGYLIKMNIDDDLYNYYHFPSESEWTGDWSGSYGSKAIIQNEAKAHAISEGVASEGSTVTAQSVYYFNTGAQFYHYDYIGEGQLVDADRVYKATPETDEELARQAVEANNFSHLDRDIFYKKASSSVWEFYSPVSVNTSIPAKDYFAGIHAVGDCYDRMVSAKTVFHELSEVALATSGHTVGYANFAGILHSSQELGYVPLVDEFLNTTGTRATYYEKGLDFALAEFKKEGESYSSNQNLLILVTDGVPNGVLNTTAEMTAYMETFLVETDAIVYFIGIDIPDDLFKTWGNAIATVDSSGEKNMRNSKDTDQLLSIQAELKKMLTETTGLSTTIEENFYMTVDENHPVTVSYMMGDSQEVTTKTVNSIDELASLGITYDAETGAVNWKAAEYNITSARLTFYETFDTESIDWELIENGERIEGVSLGNSTTSYIDYSGREQEVVMDDTASYHVEENSKLTIENTTSTPYDVMFGQEINYQIAVRNTGVLTSEDNYVYQKLPEGTTYLSSPGGTYDEATKVITYEIPTLAPGEEVVLTYIAVVDAYDFEIVSQARLGVYEETVTYNEAGVPHLVATDLFHKSAKQTVPPEPVDPPAPLNPDEGQSSQGENNQQLPAGQIGAKTGDITLFVGLGIAGAALVALVIALLLRRKMA